MTCNRAINAYNEKLMILLCECETECNEQELYGSVEHELKEI